MNFTFSIGEECAQGEKSTYSLTEFFVNLRSAKEKNEQKHRQWVRYIGFDLYTKFNSDPSVVAPGCTFQLTYQALNIMHKRQRSRTFSPTRPIIPDCDWWVNFPQL